MIDPSGSVNIPPDDSDDGGVIGISVSPLPKADDLITSTPIGKSNISAYIHVEVLSKFVASVSRLQLFQTFHFSVLPCSVNLLYTFVYISESIKNFNPSVFQALSVNTDSLYNIGKL